LLKVRDFSKIGSFLDIPDLLEVQCEAFRDFLQLDVPPAQRENKGLQATFKRAFPIEDIHTKYTLEFVEYRFGRSKFSPEEALEKGGTYSAPLKVTLRLITRSESEAQDVVEQEVFFGDLPLMTQKGSFIINGVERVVVTQLHRSPGVYFSETIHSSGKRLYSAQIIPNRGSWIELTVDPNSVLFVSIDRRRKVPATMLFKAFGYSDSEIISKFYSTKRVSVSRTKSLLDRFLASDAGSIQAGTLITESIIAAIKGAGIKSVDVVDDLTDELIINTLKKMGPITPDEAVEKIYVRVRATTASNPEAARMFLRKMLFDPRRYDLSRVGRYKINQKLGLEISPQTTVITEEDLIATIKYIIGLRKGKNELDDIDHLGNRRTRRVDEQLENQFNIALARMGANIRERMALASGTDRLFPADLVNAWLISSAIASFFATSQLSQFMEQTSPLAELTHKRRLSCLGPGGLTRKTAGFEVRDVHYSHYGRICPIETPEGPNIGLMTSLTTYAKIDEHGFIVTPYRKVKNGVVANEVVYLNALEEDRYTIAQANAPLDERGRFTTDRVLARRRGNFPVVSPSEVDFMDVSPKQMVSSSASLIPFLEHDDANRALMGSNMQRQAVPLLVPEAPIVSTGMEEKIAQDSGAAVIAEDDGVVEKVTSKEIHIRTKNDTLEVHTLTKFKRTNQDTCINQIPRVQSGWKVKAGDVLADGHSTENGLLALGKNVLAAFLPWEGYNFEDAIVVSERLGKDDVFTSTHIEEFEEEVRETKIGPEEVTWEIPNVAEEALVNLDSDGMIRIGAEVAPGDILVGKATPKGEAALTPEERLLRAIFGEKAADVRDTSLRVPSGVWGTVIDVKVLSAKPEEKYSKEQIQRMTSRIKRNILKNVHEANDAAVKVLIKHLEGKPAQENILDDKGRTIVKKGTKFTTQTLKKLQLEKVEMPPRIVKGAELSKRVEALVKETKELIAEIREDQKIELEKLKRGDELPHGVLKAVKVYVAQRRNLQVGDKLAGRHGNKGVVAKIVPEEDMPHLEDGTPIDMLLNPLGVPSRMNVGQILETHIGWAAKKLGCRVITPVFEGANAEEVKELLREAKLPENGKAVLIDGRTGRPLASPVTVGYIYMMKLSHMVEDKVHARSTGPYSLITQQPLGGKAQFGGQRFGEMEVWALEGYGAAYTLQEVLTVKSDDVKGRTALYEAIIKGENPPDPGLPASFDVLIKELNGLCLDVELLKEEE